MKKWVKTIIGIVLIAAAAISMYMWNEKGREKLHQAQLEAESAAAKAAEELEAELKRDPYEELLKTGVSFFPIPSSWISSQSSKETVGSNISIYYKRTPEVKVKSRNLLEKPEYQDYEPEYLGTYKIVCFGDYGLEIACKLEEYVGLENLVKYDENKLIFVLEAKNE